MRRLLAAIIAVAVLTGCAATEASDGRRIVAAAAGSSAMLTEMSLAAEVVAVDERNAIAGFTDLPVITAGHALNIEVLLAANPTVMIVDGLVGPSSAIDDLRNRGIEIITLDTAETLADISRKYEQLGTALDATAAAADAANAFNAKLAAFAADAKSWRIAFLYLRGTNAIYLVGGPGSGADSLIEAVGSVDVGAQTLTDPFTPLSAEVMAKLDPEVLLVMTEGLASVGGIDGLRKLPGIAQTAAGKSGRVVSVDDTTLLEFGPETLNVLESIATQLRALTTVA